MKFQFLKEGIKTPVQYYVIAGDYNVLPEALKNKMSVLEEKKVYNPKKSFLKYVLVDDTAHVVVNIEDDKGREFDRFDNLRLAIHSVMKDALANKYEEIALQIADLGYCKGTMYSIVGEMIAYNEYKFDRFKSDRSDKVLEKVFVVDPVEEKFERYAVMFEQGLKLGECINKTRFLVDEPANLLYPETLANHVVEFGKEYGFEVEVKGLEEIKALNMGAYLAVSESSANKPRLIVMRYMGNPDSKEIFGLVGKGLTYDSGGLSIKPTSGMVTMKCDMAGAATVIGAMSNIASSKLKVNVVGVVAAAENVISASCYKPGDILTSMAGKTIFIGNTDAEGRLTLIDALHYIIEKENVSEIIDLATLTGAAIVAVGSMCTAIVTNNEGLKNEVLKAAAASGEYMWELPNWDLYKNSIKHHEADYTNTTAGSGAPGTVTAGLFLGEFVQDKPWVHLDIAGPAHLSDTKGYYEKGATGHGVKTLVKLFRNRLCANKDSDCHF